MKTSIRYLLSLSISSIAKLAYLKISGKEYLVTGKCIYCGQCCERINLRSRRGWIRSMYDFEELTKKDPAYKRFFVVSKDEQGYLQFSCSHYDSDCGCRDYPNRPVICKKYPSKSLSLHGGKLIRGCGYSIQVGSSFSKHLSAETKKYKHNV